jgi:radical SAM protein with 4Fe4S-binding SPASM domain
VSLDGVDRNTYLSYRTGGDFDRVIEGIKKISSIKKREGTGPVIELQCLVTYENVGSLKKYVTLAHEIGADRVVFKTLQAASLKDGLSYLPENQEFTRYKKTNSGMIETDSYWIFRNRCLRMYYSFQIDWQGNVLPCCFDKDSRYIMGNIHDSTVAEIWKSAPYRSFRRMIITKGRILPMCLDCTEGLMRETIHA